MLGAQAFHQTLCPAGGTGISAPRPNVTLKQAITRPPSAAPVSPCQTIPTSPRTRLSPVATGRTAARHSGAVAPPSRPLPPVLTAEDASGRRAKPRVT
eukprot:366014-Chlamydomonas_euryale.AAC.1